METKLPEIELSKVEISQLCRLIFDEPVSDKAVRKLQVAILLLDKVSRRVLRMRYVQKKSYGYISSQLNKDIGQVKILCYRALHQMRCLSEKR